MYRGIMSITSTSIKALLNQLNEQKIVLPDLQRDFVWQEEQIRMLFDSAMRGYPFGAILMWETRYAEVWHRPFVREYRSGMHHAPTPKPVGTPLLMVLDGQQRLQSFFIGCYGSMNGKRLCFNVTSGPHQIDDDDDGDDANEGIGKSYRFEFWDDLAPNRPKRLLPVKDILDVADEYEDDYVQEVVAKLELSAQIGNVARRNIRLLRTTLQNPSRVAVETIDDGVNNSNQAKKIPEVLEIFVRVNSGGTKLSRSDLMFSLIKSKAQSARRDFDKLVDEVDPARALGVDNDFIIKALLVVADLSPVYSVEAIEKNWDVMWARFEVLSKALRSTIDFLRDPDVGISSCKLLRSLNTILPLIYYVSRQSNCSVPAAQRKNLRAVLYFLLYNSFIRSSDARIRYVREALQRHPGTEVPVDAIIAVIRARQTWTELATTPELVASNIPLSLCLAQPGAARQSLSWQAEPQIDHIFPQSTYRPRFGSAVDGVGNLAYLGKLRNIVKSNQEPSEFFRDVSDDDLRDQFLIADRSLLKPERFLDFVAARELLIASKVREALGR
jgi:hypothetical protein